jgi:hypothetical protein
VFCTGCGRRVAVLPRVRGRSSRKVRAGRAVCPKDHELCQKCWRAQLDRLHAERLAAAGEVGRVA